MAKLTWDEVALFENRDYLTDKYREIVGRALSHDRALQIIANLKQGREYFIAAKSAADLVRPLLIYYGLLSLTRAIVIYRTQKIEASLANGHGLTMHDFAFSASKERVGIDLLAMKCKVPGKGAFLDLLDAANCGRYSAQAVSRPHRTERLIQKQFSLPTSSAGSVISFDDVASRFSLLGGLYQDLLKRNNNAYRIRVSELESHTVFAVFPYDPVVDEPVIRRMFCLPETTPLTLHDNSASDGLDPHYRISVKGRPESLRDFPLITYADGPDSVESVVTPPLAGIGNVAVLGRMFIFAYFGSMLVRYKPSAWYSLNLKLRGDAAFPILETGLEIIEETLPGYIMDEFALPKPGAV